MEIVYKYDSVSELSNKYFLRFDSINDEKDVDAVFQIFISQGYIPRFISISPFHDHSDPDQDEIPFIDYNEFLEEIRKIGYNNVESLYAAFNKDGYIVRLQMKENRALAEWPLNKTKDIII